MTDRLSSSTRLLALLGDPVSHSLSPLFQNAAIQALGLDGVYVALRCDRTSAPPLLRALAQADGAGNVTVPHKADVLPALDRVTPAVERSGACNTFWCSKGRVWGDNTDVRGFRTAAERFIAASLRGTRVLLMGSGGAARAVLTALEEAGASRVDLLARNAGAAEALADRFGGSDMRIRVLPPGAPTDPLPYDLAVNATPLGLKEGEAGPAPEGFRFAAAMDLAYAPGGTAWVRTLLRRGIPATDGREMLLEQGAAAFERWWGRAAPVEVMRAALGLR